MVFLFFLFNLVLAITGLENPFIQYKIVELVIRKITDNTKVLLTRESNGEHREEEENASTSQPHDDVYRVSSNPSFHIQGVASLSARSDTTAPSALGHTGFG